MNLILRKAQIDDAEFLFQLRNEETVRLSAFNQEKLIFENHYNWFTKKLNDVNSLILIALVDNQKIGQVRFDIDENKNAEIDVSVSEKYSGMGYGSTILTEGCRIAFAQMKLKKVVAHIKTENIASQKAFAKAGFADNGMVKFLNFDCVEMILKEKG